MQELIEAIRNRKVVLFAGAGLSAQLGLPTWRNLINHIAKEINYDPEIFNMFGDSLALAEYYTSSKGSIGELRSWMDINWHTNVKIEDSLAHKYIVELNFPIIYTTNYDRWIEKAYQYYQKEIIKIKNVGDIRNIEEGKPQLVKFHGDFDDDNSMVLTETSYFERLDFEGPLDIKLRSDTLGKSILFIGYSLSDINIRYLLFKLQKIWEKSAYANRRPTSYLFLLKPNPIQELVLEKRGVKVIVADSDDPNTALPMFLEKLLQEANK
ncbi:SIR2 family protein [Paenibacillus alvei]|uniref:SIR2 family protein n=1 Tax=Paenibacillus alvei TaxID=44250 RepID=A0ABT4E6I5_PAEAL|nr:SIR2 family protein [Paenibacillus alvei]MCY9529335.1 SIR2 family protein [Paenibacillus alvei]